MSPTGPFDLGRGRNGPSAQGVPLLGGGRPQQAAPVPYNYDRATEDHEAVGDIVVVCLATAQERTPAGIELAPHESPFHVAVSVGSKVAGVLDVEIEEGDILVIEGGARKLDTPAGTLWFVRAHQILSVVQPRTDNRHDTMPPPPSPPSSSDPVGDAQDHS